MSGRRRFSSKRRLIDPRPDDATLEALAGQIRYVGNPQHKHDPGDFGLTPPRQPRGDKTLCDHAGITRRLDAQQLLEEGVRAGAVDARFQNGFPKHIWAVRGDVVFEAKYNNDGPGNYHGYPLFAPDPFRRIILEHWRNR